MLYKNYSSFKNISRTIWQHIFFSCLKYIETSGLTIFNWPFKHQMKVASNRELLATQNFGAGFNSRIDFLITKGLLAPLSVKIYYSQFLYRKFPQSCHNVLWFLNRFYSTECVFFAMTKWQLYYTFKDVRLLPLNQMALFYYFWKSYLPLLDYFLGGVAAVSVAQQQLPLHSFAAETLEWPWEPNNPMLSESRFPSRLR